MVLHLLHLTLLLVTASALVTPNSAPKIVRGAHVTTKCGPSLHQNAFVPVSHEACRSGVSLAMVPIESNIIASVFTATVGYIMWQEAAELSVKKKAKRSKIVVETQESNEEAKAQSDQLDPEEVVEDSKAKIDQPEESMEPSETSNDVEEAEVDSIEPEKPAKLVEPTLIPSDDSKVEESESFTDVVAAEMEKIKQVAAESFNLGPDILDIKKSVASTLAGEKEKVDRLDAMSEIDINVEEITRSSQETSQEKTSNIEETIVEAPVSGRKRRFVRKSIKKILMPWRKWSNL